MALPLVLAIALAVGASRSGGHRTVAERVNHISSQLRCPVCQGETVADSDALVARDIRTLVQQRVEAGQSDAQIIAYVVHQYPGTLLNPPASGVGLIVWALPVMVFVAAASALGFAFVRWRARPGATVTDADRALVEEALRQ
ncbi:MAG TPA: cytochrome c-type biogenesis protein [Acidimicrobiales bacterium]|nr:cytochrome c-type biogenesis protein [Acidimicrobiales bacterium]